MNWAISLIVSTCTEYSVLHECSCFIELIKRVEELSNIVWPVCNAFNKFNNILVTHMLDSIYHMTLK